MPTRIPQPRRTPARESGYAEYEPDPALRPFVECYWSRVAPAPSQDRGVRRVLPDGCIDIVFNVGQPRGQPGAPGSVGDDERIYVVGTMTRPLLIRPSDGDQFVGVRFRPGKAHAFLEVPASELTDRSVALDDLWGHTGSVHDRLSSAGDLAQRVRTLEQILMGRLSAIAGPDPLVEAAVGLILRARGNTSVETLSRSMGVTRQHLARRFGQHVGVGPKMLCRVGRFRHVLDRIDHAPEIPWSALALDLGYYDQPHLIADFKALTGVPPEQYLGAR